jgi:hypothetical protein
MLCIGSCPRAGELKGGPLIKLAARAAQCFHSENATGWHPIRHGPVSGGLIKPWFAPSRKKYVALSLDLVSAVPCLAAVAD